MAGRRKVALSGLRDGQTVEVVGCRKGQPAGAAELPLLDHVHDLDARDDLHRRPEGLEPIIGRVRFLMAR